MSKNDFIIVGLGNPGREYDRTRHNIGFYMVDELARRFGFELSLNKWDALYSRINLWGHKICFVKPQTYMNLSGRAVSRLAGFYKIPSQRILVIHDDIDMGCGRLKLVSGGGAGGHNGIRSLIQSLGTRDFYRFKFGVGRPGQSDVSEKMAVDKFVLAPFTHREKSIVEDRVDSVERGVELFVQGDIAAAMNLINKIK